jgi:hypothetical protein
MRMPMNFTRNWPVRTRVPGRPLPTGSAIILAQATQHDVLCALEDMSLAGGWPEDEADLLEFFNAMVRIMLPDDPPM